MLDTDLAGRQDAMNPVELLLSALAACMLKGIERVTPMLKFRIDGAEVSLEAKRQARRCCRTLTFKDSPSDFRLLGGPHEQAITRPLSHDELVPAKRPRFATAVEFIPGTDGDSPVLPELLGQIPEGEDIGTVTADGACDTDERLT